MGAEIFGGVSDDGVKINFSTNVADVDGMLIALNAIVDSGNQVTFRQEARGGSYITNESNGKITKMKRLGGSWKYDIWVPRPQEIHDNVNKKPEESF